MHTQKIPTRFIINVSSRLLSLAIAAVANRIHRGGEHQNLLFHCHRPALPDHIQHQRIVPAFRLPAYQLTCKRYNTLWQTTDGLQVLHTPVRLLACPPPPSSLVLLLVVRTR